MNFCEISGTVLVPYLGAGTESQDRCCELSSLACSVLSGPRVTCTWSPVPWTCRWASQALLGLRVPGNLCQGLTLGLAGVPGVMCTWSPVSGACQAFLGHVYLETWARDCRWASQGFGGHVFRSPVSGTCRWASQAVLRSCVPGDVCSGRAAGPLRLPWVLGTW